jgi:CspA family cold shock protein
MSKKNKGFISQSSSGAGMSHETEYRIIKFDLVRVVALNFVDEIRENDEVTFELEKGKKGLNAVNVKLV